MTKRTSRISDASLIRIEADLAHLDAEYVKVMDNPDPALEGFIKGLLVRMSALEEKAIARPPVTAAGLAIQARIVARCITCDSMVAS